MHDFRRIRLMWFSVIFLCFSAREVEATERVVVPAEKPNILWITSEDNSHHWIGCYGNEQAETPNIDRLAAEGVRYKFAYSNAAVCAVARNTLVLGRHACGMGTQNMRSRYPIPKSFRTCPSLLRSAGYYCVNRSKTDYNFRTDDKSHWDECGRKAHWKNRKPSQPFFAVFNSTISHESSLFPAKTDSLRKRNQIPTQPKRNPGSVVLPTIYPDTIEIRRDWVTYMDVVSAMDRQVGTWVEELKQNDLLENTIVFYFSDHGGVLPRSKRYVYDSGTRVPLIVRFPKKWQHLSTDAAGTVCDRPVSFVDLPATVFSLAGLEIPDGFQGRAIAGPKMAEPEPFVFLYGQRFDSRMLRFVRAVTDGEYRYIRNFFPHRHRGIFTGYPHGQAGWQSVFKLRQAGGLNIAQEAYWKIPQPVEELYHTAKDPWELTNLVDDVAQKERLERMRRATYQKMREVLDTGIVPESMYADISKTSTIYDYVNHQDFPFDEVFETIVAISDDRTSKDENLLAAMHHEHAVIRYWGVVGCIIRAKSSEKILAQLQKNLEDPSQAVRVVASEALFVLGEETTGVEHLVRILEETDDAVVSLEALNVAQALGVMDRIPKHVWERACSVGSYSRRMAEDQGRPNLFKIGRESIQ